MAFNQTCTAILLRQGQELLDFGDLDPSFKVRQGLTVLSISFRKSFFA